MSTSERERLSALAATFPVLAGAPGCSPFDAEALARWRDGNDCIGAAWFAASFILSVAGYSHDFDAVSAVASWPSDCRAAFMAWAAAPWTVGSSDRGGRR